MFVHREAVRFRDLDPMGHVNNAVFLTYIESARAAFLQHLGAVQTLEDLAIIVARIEIDFRAPVRFGDEVFVNLRAHAIRICSMPMAGGAIELAPVRGEVAEIMGVAMVIEQKAPTGQAVLQWIAAHGHDACLRQHGANSAHV